MMLRGKTWDDVLKSLEKEWAQEPGKKMTRASMREAAKEMVCTIASRIAADVLAMAPALQREVANHMADYERAKMLEAQDPTYVTCVRGNHVSKFVVDFAHQLTENVARVYLCRPWLARVF